MRKKVWIILNDFISNMNKKNIGAYAASTAFFSFISTIPALVLVCYILPYTPLTEGDLLAAIQEIMPDMVLPMISEVIAEIYKEIRL